jgi:hypothetical protein
MEKTVMNKSLVAVSSILLGATVAFAATKLISLSGGAALDIASEGQGVRVSKTQTEFHEDIHETKRLYKVVSRIVYNTNSEGQDAQTVVESYATKKNLFDTKSWTKKFKGTGFEIFSNELLQVTEGGCCGASDVNRLINAQTGVVTEAALDSSTITISAPNTNLPLRYLAVAMDSSAPAKKGDKRYIGTISYFSAGKIRSRARIYASLPEGYGTQIEELKVLQASPKDQLIGKKLDLFSVEATDNAEKAYTGFGVSAKAHVVDSEEAFRVMITNDRIDASLVKTTGKIEVDVVQL